jgi:hypothetical protein
VGVVFFAALRWRYEHRFGRVQIVLDFDDVAIVADGGHVPPERMLRALRQRGATGLALNEQTLTLLRESGRLAVTPRAEALQIFPSLRAPFADARLAYLVWNAADPRLMRAVEEHLREQSLREGPARGVNLPNGVRGVLVPTSSQLFNDVTLGYDWTHLGAARAAGLRPVARMANRLNMNAARLGLRLGEARATGARLVIFDDAEIPGYSSLTGELARGLDDHGLSFGALEFSSQRGAAELAEASGGNLYRVHAVAPNEAAKWRLDELADRYARAARERNVRVLMVRLLRRPGRAPGGPGADVLA